MEKHDLQQQSISSVSSYDSDSDLIKRMPILNMSYSPGLLLPEKKRCSKTDIKAPSGGDVLLFGFDSEETSKQLKTTEQTSNQNLSFIENNNDDVVDSVPTRTGKQKNLFDPKDTQDIVEEIPKANHKVSENIENVSAKSTDLKVPPKHICCAVFCALFKCKYILTRYTIIDLILNIGSICLYLFDFVTDWANALAYYLRRDEDPDNLFYLGLTVFAIVLPSIIMHFFSAWWEIEDNRLIKKKKKQNIEAERGCCYYIWIVLFHLLQIAPIYRYVRTISFGLKSRYKEVCGKEDRWRFYDLKYKGELLDVNFIRLMESFLEAAPQIVLQIFIMIRTVQTPTITVLSVCVSLFGMSITFLAYERALRNTLEEKDQLSVFASVILLLYRILTILARVISLALLLNTNVWAWIGFFLGRWWLMSILIAYQKTQFCNTKAKEYVYDFVIGFCYTFAYFNVHYDLKNRYRMFAYYSLTLIENLAMSICWFYWRRGGGSLINALLGTKETNDEMLDGAVSTETALALVILVIVLYLLGMVFFFIYYIGLHPEAKRASLCLRNETDDDKQLEDFPPSSKTTCGDNYKTSMHNASIDCNLEEFKKLKRPASEVLSSPSTLYDHTPHNNEPKEQLASAACSSFSVESVPTGAQVLGAGDFCGREKVPSQNRNSITSYGMAMLHYEDGAELKRQQVSLLLELKQKRKREIEHQLSLITRKRPGENDLQQDREEASAKHKLEMQDFFNRKTRALHLCSPRSVTPSSDVTTRGPLNPRGLADSPLRSTVSSVLSVQRSRDAEQLQTVAASNQLESFESGNASPKSKQPRHSRFVSSGCGTFPRTARLDRSLLHKRQGSLKTIREDRASGQLSADRRNNASLMNLGRSRPGRSVPRTMSCTIAHDEVIEAVESSL